MESDPNDMLRKTSNSRYPLTLPRRQTVALVWTVCLLGLAAAVTGAIKPTGGLRVRTTAHHAVRRFVQRHLRQEPAAHGVHHASAKITVPGKHALVFRRSPRVRRDQSGMASGFAPKTIRGPFFPFLLPLRTQAPRNARYTPLPFRAFASVSSRAPPFFV